MLKLDNEKQEAEDILVIFLVLSKRSDKNFWNHNAEEVMHHLL